MDTQETYNQMVTDHEGTYVKFVFLKKDLNYSRLITKLHSYFFNIVTHLSVPFLLLLDYHSENDKTLNIFTQTDSEDDYHMQNYLRYASKSIN